MYFFRKKIHKTLNIKSIDVQKLKYVKRSAGRSLQELSAYYQIMMRRFILPQILKRDLC